MFKVTLRNLGAHKRRLFSTFLAVVLGVAFLAGNLVLTDTITKTFDELFADVNRGTDVVVRNATTIEGDFGGETRGRIPIDLMDVVATVEGVKAAEPQIQGYGQIVGKDGKAIGDPGQGAPTFAGNWSTVPELRAFTIVEGDEPRTDDEMVIDKKSADDGGLRVGDRTTLLTAAGPNQFAVAGIAKFGSADSPGGASFALVTLAAAEKYIAKPGEADTIRIVGDGRASQEELAARVQQALPSGSEAVTGAQVTTEQQDDIQEGLSAFFNFLLRPFAIIAILVSIFSIYNTFSIIVAQRTREMALLRALGARRRQVMTSVVLEALVIGVIAAVVGLFAGLGVAALLKAVLAGFGLDVPAGSLVLKGSTVQWALAIGIGIPVLTSIVPAVKASRVPPIAALRSVAVETTRVSKVRIGIGVLATALGLVNILAGVAQKGSDGLAKVGIGALLIIVAFVVLGPAVAGPVARMIGAPLPRLRGVAGTLARENAVRNPRRTSGAAAALLIGAAVVALFTVFASSIKASVDDQIDRSFAGDIVVDSETFGFGGFNPQLARDIGEVPEVRAVSGIRFGLATLNGSDRQVAVIDPATISEVFDLGIDRGSLGDMGAGTVAIATRYADDHDLDVGDRIDAKYADGATNTLTIVATFKNSDVFQSNFTLPTAEWSPHAVDDLDAMVIAKLQSGVGIDQGRQAIEEVAASYPNAKVRDRQAFKETVFAQVNMILGLVFVMLFLAIVIALMGIANTLSLSIHERTRELGLLRAVGETRPQLRAMVRWESVIIALFGTVGGLAIGTLCGWALVTASSDSGFAKFALPAGSLIAVLVAGAIAGVLAGVFPARRASRLNVLDAIASE